MALLIYSGHRTPSNLIFQTLQRRYLVRLRLAVTLLEMVGGRGYYVASTTMNVSFKDARMKLFP